MKCWFTSAETVGLLGTGAQDGHLDFHTPPVLWSCLKFPGPLFIGRPTIKLKLAPSLPPTIMFWGEKCAMHVQRDNFSDKSTFGVVLFSILMQIYPHADKTNGNNNNNNKERISNFSFCSPAYSRAAKGLKFKRVVASTGRRIKIQEWKDICSPVTY